MEGKLPQGDALKEFYKIDTNKEGIQQIIGENLIRNAPPHKTIVVSGAFENPTDVHCSSKINVDGLMSDHTEADT